MSAGNRNPRKNFDSIERGSFAQCTVNVGLMACGETGSEVANTLEVANIIAKQENLNLTYLDQLVPAGRDDHRVLGVGREANARNPLSVALVGDGELAVTEGVPELDGPVAGARDNLAVVGRERDRKDVVGVTDEPAGGGAGGELPQAEGLVPGSGEGIGTVRRDHLPRQSAQLNSSIFLNPVIQEPAMQAKRTQSETMWEWPWRDRFG